MPDNLAGWCYVLEHPAWAKIGLVKIGMTGRDPATRGAEITSSSGLLAPAKVAYCAWVADRTAVERTVKQMLGSQRVRGRRELFRTDVATAPGRQSKPQPVGRPLPRWSRAGGRGRVMGGWHFVGITDAAAGRPMRLRWPGWRCCTWCCLSPGSSHPHPGPVVKLQGQHHTNALKEVIVLKQELAKRS
jgi:hypothetical protein